MSVTSSLHPIDSYIGSKIRTHRKKLSLSQSDLANLLKISHQQIQKYEQGLTRISVSTLYDISRVMGVVPGFFYEGFQLNASHATPPASQDIISSERPRSLNILLVEDDASDEILARKALESCASDITISIHTAHDGVEALQFLRNNLSSSFLMPDIILLDLNIPKKQGIEVLKEIKNDRNMRHIPVIILTHSINAAEMFETYKLYASGYIAKSFDVNRFNKDISNMIEYWLTTVVLPNSY